MTYLITNRLGTSLLIADIGVRLEPGSSKELMEHTFKSSRQLREYEQKKWVGIAVRSAAPKKVPMPIWPFSSTPASVPTPTPSPSPDTTILHGLVAKLENLIVGLQARTSTTGPTAATELTVIQQPQRSDEPMFIPSQIVPDTADVSINVATSETDRQGFDAGLEALKKARKR